MIINLANNIPDSELIPVVDILKSLYRLINNKNYIEETEPDQWDLKMIAEAKEENDGTTYSLDEVLKECGLTYEDIQD